MNIQDLIMRVNAGGKLTESEAAFYIRHNPVALAAFMIENNPGSLNLALRNLGYDHLDFAPDKTALTRQTQIIIDQKHAKDWDAIVSKFHIDASKLSPSLLEKIKTEFAKV